MKEIKLNKTRGKKGFVALVDDEDYAYLNQFNWSLNGKGYAIATIDTNICKLMHKLITRTDKTELIDHIDHNGLNNQKYNLRRCTYSQNQMNKSPRGKSKYLGVSLQIKKRLYYRKKTMEIVEYIHINWLSSIRHEKKQIHLGIFKDEIMAALAYDKAAIVYHGEFANLNFK